MKAFSISVLKIFIFDSIESLLYVTILRKPL